MTTIGYARTSTVDQINGFADQQTRLKAAGCTKLFTEQLSSIGERPQFDAMLAYVREGDVVVATKIDRLARNVVELLGFAQQLKDRGVGLRILDLSVDTTSPTGWLILTIIGGVAEMERTQMLERQAVGINAAKTAGKYRGRQPTAQSKVDQVLALHADKRTPTYIAKCVGIAKGTVYRILKDAGISIG
jgi:DNA invertase Pin-like site-specific DNA recombinase